MKCALELMATAAVKAEEIEREKKLTEQREREAKRIRTIRYCEKLGNQLEALAEKGKNPSTSFYCTGYNHRPLTETFSDYADKRLSYKCCGEALDLQVMANWFADFCFIVTLKKFNYYAYGFGLCSGYEVVISPKAECLQ